MKAPGDGISHLPPKIPEWAIDGGAPAPAEGETIFEYTQSLGIDWEALRGDLTPREGPIIHVRLVHALAERYPDAWQAHVRRFVSRHAQITNGNGHRPEGTL